MSLTDLLVEKDLVPEILIRSKIRSLLKQRLNEEKRIKDQASDYQLLKKTSLSSGPIAVHTDKANEQHYEVPAAFYKLVLGPRLKYSSGFWGDNNFVSSEERMLQLTCERAELKNGHSVLELGCGWGSLTLYMAEHFPDSQITAVSNSLSQAEYIREAAASKAFKNITVITADINDLETDPTFDRVVSVEMFEHMRNYDALLKKVCGFLNDDGRIFIHIFTHKEYFYKFDAVDETDWMSEYFFSGGIMPSDDLLFQFPEIVIVNKHWIVPGTHYSKTAEAWLKNLRANKKEVLSLFNKCYSGEELKWYAYWKIFFLSCSELWNYNNGKEWFVSHYLLQKP